MKIIFIFPAHFEVGNIFLEKSSHLTSRCVINHSRENSRGGSKALNIEKYVLQIVR